MRCEEQPKQTGVRPMGKRMSVVGRLLAACAVLMTPGPLAAKINPNFTPNHLLDNSEQVLVLRLKPADGQGVVRSAVRRGLKGEEPKAAPLIDLHAAPQKAHAESVEKALRRLRGPALLFVGADEEGEECAFLHLAGRWVRLQAGKKPGRWDMEHISVNMEGTWAGGTDMLLRTIELLLEHPAVTVPVDAGCAWAEPQKIGKLGGVHDLGAVDLLGDGRPFLFAAASSGDRLYRCDLRTGRYKDETDARGLASRSRAAAWADFDGDGRLDLASFDGEAISLWLQTETGKLRAPRRPIRRLRGCLGLAPLDVGRSRPALLVSMPRGPVVLRRQRDASYRPTSLKPSPKQAKAAGRLGRCLVADFDGDARPDLLLPGSAAGLFYRGRPKGAFAAPVGLELTLGKGQAEAFVGDWDHDGRFDVFTAAEDGCRLWQNRGDLVFRETLGVSGEVAYISKPGAIGGGVCDVNNDGRQDLLILYDAMLPQIFFNRGFRSFGHARGLSVDRLEAAGGRPNPGERELLGAQAGLVRDLTDDGAQDLAVVLRHQVRNEPPDGDPGPWRRGPRNGELWVFPREVDEAFGLALRVALPSDRPDAGPLAVTGRIEERSLGAWNVRPGVADAFFGRLEAGPVRIRWRMPGGEVQGRSVVVEKPVRVLIGPRK
ncbi:MAG: VCBS repeat-containing protein [Planctomycetota bacterium]